PDGWLYGCHGVFTHSRVGKPGASDAERTRINAAVWRFHPTRHDFEIFSEGTSNPWGIDFDAEGQCIIEACVIPHLFHMIQGGRYERQGGQHFNPYTFEDLKTIADHVHWAGSKGPHAANSRSDMAGGGHAHAGLMVYQGAAWPEEYSGKVFMNNIHGQRINMDILERRGSGFVGRHGPDFVNFNDSWSQVLNLLSDQDGSVYLIDWYDKNQCHHGNTDGHDRTNGRIFKLVHSKTRWTPVDLAAKSDEDLARLVLHPNEFHVRHARRILQERAAGKGVSAGAVEALRTILREHADPSRRLRALWALHVVGQAGEDLLLGLLGGAPEHVRAWALQLLHEMKTPSDAAIRETARLAREDASPVVRLYVACALQRTPPEKRWDALTALLARAEDANDHNLPLMAWYAAEPLVPLDLDRALALALDAKLPGILGFAVRRAAAIDKPEARAAIARTILAATGDARQLEALGGLSRALRGRRGVPMPGGWAEVEAKLAESPNADVRVLAQSISVAFGSATALSRLMAALADRTEAPGVRRTALESLLGARDPKLPAALQGLLDDPVLRGQAIRALAAFDDPATPAALLAAYKGLDPSEKRDALSTLASRVVFAGPLLEAVGAGSISAKDLTADLVRQLRSFKDPGIDAKVEKVWGAYRESTADRKKEIERYRKIYAAGGSQPGDASRGRAVYTRICQQCHVLFDVGGKVGPDLTGSNRNDLEYILQNMVDPNAVIPNDYRAWTLALKDGRVLTGLLKTQDAQLVTLATASETVVVPRGDIETLEESEASMMPENLLAPLTEVEVRDLVYYLSRQGQVPLIASRENLGLFFNGKDLTGWDGDPEVWRVEGDEIVGSSAKGLKHNSFLKNQLILGDFRLVCEVKLRPNSENSGIQFRSTPLPGGEVRGYQADAGKGWWGKLYEEEGRALLWDRSGEAHVKPDEWNTYEILAVGSRIRTAINGKLCVDLDDPAGAKNGIVALQAHSGGPLEVRFRSFRLELDPEFQLSTP
ncbi:MAG TPA: PVC-type heme-binding CxxCH protein, partial [Planctomycetota bacterium]|nr:PVC-type heme-binding CxxCH protein [Planctomycetota bacterium]